MLANVARWGLCSTMRKDCATRARYFCTCLHITCRKIAETASASLRLGGGGRGRPREPPVSLSGAFRELETVWEAARPASVAGPAPAYAGPAARGAGPKSSTNERLRAGRDTGQSPGRPRARPRPPSRASGAQLSAGYGASCGPCAPRERAMGKWCFGRKPGRTLGLLMLVILSFLVFRRWESPARHLPDSRHLSLPHPQFSPPLSPEGGSPKSPRPANYESPPGRGIQPLLFWVGRPSPD